MAPCHGLWEHGRSKGRKNKCGSTCFAGNYTCLRRDISYSSKQIVFFARRTYWPLPACVLMVLTEAPLSYMLGFIFGHASKAFFKSKNPYGYESLGALIGSFITFACVAWYFNNIVIVVCASIALMVVIHGRNQYRIAALAVMLGLIFFNDYSMHWKYRFPFSKILFCREGEIVVVQGAGDTTFMLNGSVSKSTLEKPFLEQAVACSHGPRGQSSTRACNFRQRPEC